MRTALRILAIAGFASLTMGLGAAYAQTTPAPSTCGVETWSTDKMTYVTVPCSGGQTVPETAKAPAAAGTSATNCGVETWSTDKMTYVTTPCSHVTTEENPAGAGK